MEKPTILDLLTKPNMNDQMYSDIVTSYLKNIKCSANYAVITQVPVPPAPLTEADVPGYTTIHRRIYSEALDILIDRFNQYAFFPITGVSGSDFAEEFISTMTHFLHEFYRKYQGTYPQTDERYPVMSIEIKFKEDEENEQQYFAFCCTAVLCSPNPVDVIRQMEMRFYVQ